MWQRFRNRWTGVVNMSSIYAVVWEHARPSHVALRTIMQAACKQWRVQVFCGVKCDRAWICIILYIQRIWPTPVYTSNWWESLFTPCHSLYEYWCAYTCTGMYMYFQTRHFTPMIWSIYCTSYNVCIHTCMYFTINSIFPAFMERILTLSIWTFP